MAHENYNDGAKFTVSVKSGTALITSKEPTRTVTPVDENLKKEIAIWGKNNDAPNALLDRIENISLIHPILDWKVRALYSRGLAYGFVKTDENENEVRTPVVDLEINEWLKRTCIQQYLMDAFADATYFYNIFPEVVFSNDRKKINKLFAQKAKNCRWEIAKDNGVSEKLLLSSKWDQGIKKGDKRIKPLPVLDLTTDFRIQLSAKKKCNWILPVKFPSPGRDYYGRAPWRSLVNTKWLDIAEDVPKSKHALLKNLLAIKYLVYVPEWWWTSKYPNFDSLDQKEKQKIVDQEHENFNKFLTGVENVGKSLMVTVKDSFKDHKYADWKVDAVDDKIAEGKYIEDSQEADAHIFKNLQVDPTLFGSGPGKNTQSSGSGSDKRVAWNLYDLLQTPIQDLVLSPLDYIADFNGWVKRLREKHDPKGEAEFRFWIKSSLITTLDKGETEKN